MIPCCPCRDYHTSQEFPYPCCKTIRMQANFLARHIISTACLGAVEGFIIGSYRAQELVEEEQTWFQTALDVEAKLNAGSVDLYSPDESTFDYYLQRSETAYQEISSTLWNPVLIAASCGAAIGCACGCYEVFIKALCPDSPKVD